MILGSKAAQQHPEAVRGLWQACGDIMFSLEPRLRHLGLGKEVRLRARSLLCRCLWGAGGSPDAETSVCLSATVWEREVL